MAINHKTSHRRSSIEISVIVWARDEGRLLHHTLKCVSKAAAYAQQKKSFKTETIVVTDNASESTERYLKDFGYTTIKNLRVYSVNYNDSGKARNTGIQKAKGEFVAIIKAGDLVSENWLSDAAEMVSKGNNPIIARPSFALAFEARDYLFKMLSSSDRNFHPGCLAESNCFSSLMMTRKGIAIQFPYESMAINGLEYDTDWQWTCNTLAEGVEHVVIPKSLHCVRFRVGYQDKIELIIARTKLLDPQCQADSVSEEEKGERASLPEKGLALARGVVDSWYNSVLTRAVRKVHPRLDLYFTSMRNETRHLFRPITNGREQIPEWLVEEVNALHQIDLRIFLSAHLQSTIEQNIPRLSEFSLAYWKTARQISTNTDLLFVVPYLKNGGAEKEMNNLIKVVLKIKPDLNIKILTTEPGDSPFAANLDKRVTFIESGELFSKLNPNKQAKLLFMLCQQLQPRKLHIINSTPGYLAIQKFGETINKKTKIFISIFMIDKTSEGRNTHLFTETMPEAIDWVTKVFTDNNNVVTQLSELMAIKKDKFSVHHQPLAEDEKIMKLDNWPRSKPLKILWAGRMDRQKRPDILIKIAGESKKRKISAEFYVYGSPAFDMHYLNEIKQSNSINYLGPYEGGLKSLPLSDFDIFLLTSEWEGMPNVLLEAIAGGLLVITPDVGGVSDIIKNNDNGYLVKEFDNVNDYVSAISDAEKNISKAQILIRRALSTVNKKFSGEQYEASIKAEREYLSN